MQTGYLQQYITDTDNIWVWSPNITYGWQRKKWNLYLGSKIHFHKSHLEMIGLKTGVRKKFGKHFFPGLNMEPSIKTLINPTIISGVEREPCFGKSTYKHVILRLQTAKSCMTRGS